MKGTQDPIIKIAPPKKPSSKGEPPARTQTHQNLETPHGGEIKDLNFKVPAEFKKEFQQLALDEGKRGIELFVEMFHFYKSKHNS
jgi:hypothetical protein